MVTRFHGHVEQETDGDFVRYEDYRKAAADLRDAKLLLGTMVLALRSGASNEKVLASIKDGIGLLPE